MKKSLLFLTAFACVALFGCDQSQTSSASSANKEASDKRPKEELTLINKFAAADSALNKQANDLGKQAVADSARADVSNYLTNTINAKATNWVAYVGSIETSGDAVNVDLWIPKAGDMRGSDPERRSIHLKASVSATDTAIKKMIMPLKLIDKVVVSGQFVKLANKVDEDVTFLGINMVIEEVLTQPEYNFKITDIKKYQ